MKKGEDWRNTLSQMAAAEGMDLASLQKEEATKPTKKQQLTIKEEKRGGAQKKATIIYGYDGSDEEIAEFGALLRKKLSTGGSARGGEILLQGEVAEKAQREIESMGHKARILK